jgi:hypothetical protein
VVLSWRFVRRGVQVVSPCPCSLSPWISKGLAVPTQSAPIPADYGAVPDIQEPRRRRPYVRRSRCAGNPPPAPLVEERVNSALPESLDNGAVVQRHYRGLGHPLDRNGELGPAARLLPMPGDAGR